MKPNLGIAYAVKKKSSKPKMMAEGGPVSAKSEKRPMPEQKSADSMEVSLNSSKKALPQSTWTDKPTVAQAQSKPRTQPIRRPKMVPSDAFSTKLHNQEDDLMEMKPASPEEKPKGYFEGGVVSEKDSENDNVDHPAGLEEDNDQMHPAEDEYMASHFAEGGEVEEDHHDSITAAIMAKRDRMHAMIDSGSMDEDDAVRMADGGMVDIDSNNEEQPNSYYNRNEHAALKENYDSDMDDLSEPMDSNEMGDSREDDEENKLDMVSSIRSKMNMKRQFR